MESTQRRRRSWPLIIGFICVPLLGGGAYALVRGILGAAPPQPKKVVQEIKVIRPPPPPPDLPPPPPPPPEEKVDIPDPQPQPDPDPTPSNDPPPSEQLGLDAEGTAGGDAFGLVGHKGGREITASGGSAYAWYAGLLKNEIMDHLSAESETRNGKYSAVIMVCVEDDGTIGSAKFTRGTGDRARDQAIVTKLTGVRLERAPPADMPCVSYKLESHG